MRQCEALWPLIAAMLFTLKPSMSAHLPSAEFLEGLMFQMLGGFIVMLEAVERAYALASSSPGLT